jgi:O-antigen biosynthesis protein WbqV
MSTRGDVSVYVLNMGQPVKIVELAERMIRLSGLEPNRDIDIVFTGVRPGERLHEILFAHDEVNIDIGVPGVVAAKPIYPSMEKLRKWLEEIDLAIGKGNSAVLHEILCDAVPDFHADQRNSAEERGPHADIGTRA